MSVNILSKCQENYRLQSKTLNKFGIKLEQVLGLMTDNPNLMRGHKKGVFKHLKDMIPTLLDLGQCSLHHVMNAMQAGFKEIRRTVDIANYFKNRSTRRAYYKEVQKEGNLPPHAKSNDFLHPVDPCFLYFGPVCRRLLEQD